MAKFDWSRFTSNGAGPLFQALATDLFAEQVGEDRAVRLQLVSSVVNPESVWTIGDVIAPLLVHVDGVRDFAETAEHWLRERKLVAADEISTLLRRALDERSLNESSLPAGTLALGLELVSGNQPIERRRVGLAILAELRGGAGACAELAEIATNGDDILQEEAHRSLGGFGRPVGAYSSPVGEVPPAFQTIREKLNESLRLCRTPGARVVVSELQRNVEDRIERHLRDEEDFASRRRQ